MSSHVDDTKPELPPDDAPSRLRGAGRRARLLAWMRAHRLLTACLVVFVLFGALNVVAFHHARALTTFTPGGQRTARPEALGFWQRVGALCFGVNNPRPTITRTPKDVDLHFEIVKLSTYDRVNLEAWWIEVPEPRAVLVLCHGYAASKSTLLDAAVEFHALRCSTLLVDFRGSGGSDGNSTSLGYHESRDVAAAMRWARGKVDGTPVILMGSSMGAVAAMRAVHVEGVLPDGLIMEAPFSHLLTTTQRRFDLMGLPRWPGAELLVFWGGVQQDMDGFDHDATAYARSVTCPTLVLHGSADERVTVADVQRVFSALRTPRKQLTLLPGVRHEPYLIAARVSWSAAIRSWLLRL